MDYFLLFLFFRMVQFCSKENTKEIKGRIPIEELIPWLQKLNAEGFGRESLNYFFERYTHELHRQKLSGEGRNKLQVTTRQ